MKDATPQGVHTKPKRRQKDSAEGGGSGRTQAREAGLEAGVGWEPRGRGRVGTLPGAFQAAGTQGHAAVTTHRTDR